MKYNISISKQDFQEKPQGKHIAKLVFTESYIELPTFADLIKKGHCYCSNFNTTGKEFSIKEKTIERFRDTHIVSLDIDNGNKPFKQFVEKLKYTPTMAYTTPSYSLADNKFKYRLLYVFDKPISVIEEYQTIYFSLISQVEKDNDFTNKDNCTANIAQYCNGSYNCQMINDFNATYNIGDIATVDRINKKNHSFKNKKEYSVNDSDLRLEAEFLKDLNTIEPFEFIKKYKAKYPYFDHSKLNFKDGYALLDENYKQIYRNYKWVDAELKTGEHKLTTITKRIKDGEGRRRKLVISAMIRKQIMPNITNEHMLFNLVYDRAYFFENSDNKLTNQELIRITKYVQSLNHINVCSTDKRKFIVDKSYWAQKGIKPKAAKQMVSKKINMEKISEYYDSSIPVAANFKKLSDLGIKVSLRTLYNYVKTNNIKTKVDISEWYDFSLTVKENLQLAKDSGLKISKSALYNWLKQNKKSEIEETASIETGIEADNTAIYKNYINNSICLNNMALTAIEQLKFDNVTDFQTSGKQNNLNEFKYNRGLATEIMMHYASNYF